MIKNVLLQDLTLARFASLNANDKEAKRARVRSCMIKNVLLQDLTLARFASLSLAF